MSSPKKIRDSDIVLIKNCIVLKVTNTIIINKRNLLSFFYVFVVDFAVVELRYGHVT